MAELIGRTLGGRYEVLELIGEGGMAEVYKARHLQLDRLVAVKVMLPFLTREGNFDLRFEREARVIAQLHHPHIIQVYDFEAIPSENLYYMVVELIRGSSLAEVLLRWREQNQSLPLAEALRISRDVASALSYAHRQGMIHRDIKPGNVMVDENSRVVLTDFGLVRIAATGQGGNLTASGSLVGTPAYMAPEQGLGEPGDARSDLYSLGVMMYQMVTSKLPFSAETPIALMMRHINDIAEPPSRTNSNLPIGVENVITRLLAKAPADRYQDADALIRDIDDLDNVPLVVSKPLKVTAPPTVNLSSTAALVSTTLPRRSNLTWIIGLGVVSLLMVGAVFLGYGLFNKGENPTLLPTAQTQQATEQVTQETTQQATQDVSLGSCTATAAVDIELRSGPGEVFPKIGVQLLSGSNAAILGVFRDTPDQVTWWQIQINNQPGWIPETTITLGGDCQNIPSVTVDTPIPPTKTPFLRRPTTTITRTSTIVPTVHPTDVPSTDVPPTAIPPTDIPPTDIPPTAIPPTDVPPTDVPPTVVPSSNLPPDSTGVGNGIVSN